MVENDKIIRLRKLASLMDSRIRGPFGISFGLDGLLGLIPVIGDLITTVISIYILIQAVSFGCGPAVIMRMGLNLIIESLIEVIPFLGNLFDFFWKANNKNIILLEQHLVDSRSVQVRSRLVLALVAFILLGFLVASLAVTLLILYKLVDFFNLAFS